jgi:hypothetical protein
VKQQYFGDVNDFVKYALLRSLALRGIDLTVCWMLTAADGRTDGRRIDYLGHPERFRQLCPPVFDLLEAAVAANKRDVAAIEQSGLLPGARYHTAWLEDSVSERTQYFEDLYREVPERGIVFFDPDNGVAVPSIRKGAKGSSRYLYVDELRRAIGEQRSAVVYQHFPRVARVPFAHALLDRLADHTGLRGFVMATSSVALVCLPQDHEGSMLPAAREIEALAAGFIWILA